MKYMALMGEPAGGEALCYDVHVIVQCTHGKPYPKHMW